MAITFNPKDINGSTLDASLVIGGAEVGRGIVGPMPKYSISRQTTILSDGSYAANKYTINVNGTAIIRASDNQDITVLGERADGLQGEVLNLIQFAKKKEFTHGSLNITSYGGGSNSITFEDAKLISVDAPDQSDENAGVQNIEYSFVFEAYNITNTSSNSGAITTSDNPLYLLTDVKDSWDFQKSDSVNYELGATGVNFTTPFNTYVVTRNLSATAARDLVGLESPISIARRWVESRLISVLGVGLKISGDTFSLDEKETNKFDVNPVLNFPNYSDYLNINHVRSISSDILTGTYSVTDTWTLNKGTLANFDISIEVETSQDKEANVVSIKATLEGVDTVSYDQVTQNKYQNALIAFNLFKPLVFQFALAAYNDMGLTRNLRNVKTSESTTTNTGTGTISYSVTMDDLTTTLEGALTESINVEDDNEDGLNEVIAKIDIIGKPDGPIIQDMSTTTIKSRSVTIDAVMDRDHRIIKPSAQALAVADNYKPNGKAFRQSKRESWNPRSGKYSLSINWEYTSSLTSTGGGGTIVF